MLIDDDEFTRPYRVVVNHDERYSIWPVDYDLPAGWRDAGHTGVKDDCLAYVRQVWTGLRPLSLGQRHTADRGDRS